MNHVIYKILETKTEFYFKYTISQAYTSWCSSAERR